MFNFSSLDGGEVESSHFENLYEASPTDCRAIIFINTFTNLIIPNQGFPEVPDFHLILSFVAENLPHGVELILGVLFRPLPGHFGTFLLAFGRNFGDF